MTTDVKQLLETMPEAPEAWADAQIGRYQFRRLVGTGGMGIVVAAHDPELDREVAIKIVVTGETDDNRPVREAQAMARLSHPNVVQVYEVIRLGERTAIVMELVEGEELGTWQTAKRGWREIIDAYVQASRGLAAAHRAGIVHRDFKPSNALVDRDGVVRVTDFGLAQPSTERAGTESGSNPVGTPAYMAPEQHRNDTVDARTDQWGLACSLYEALYGRRPFESAEGARLAAAVTRGEIDDEPDDTQVPRRIRRAIRRALAVDPEQRFATVEDFAAALSVRSRRKAYALAVFAAVAVVTIVVLATYTPADPRPCEGLDAPIRAVWSDRARAGVRTRLLAPSTGLPAGTVDKALDGLDAYAASWTSTRTQACLDSQQGVRSPETLDTRMRCLDHRLAEVSGLLEGVTTGEAATLRATGDAVGALAPPTTCSEAKDLARPASPDARAELDAAEQQLARANALYLLGQYERAAPLIEVAVAVGERIKATDLTARAVMARGHCEDRLENYKAALVTYQRGAKLAAQAQNHVVVAEALSDIFFSLGEHLGRPADALASRPFVELAIEAAGRPDAVRSLFLHYLAVLLQADPSKVEEAVTVERESLAIRTRIYPSGSVYIFDSMETLANAESARGNFDEAERLLKQVIEGRIAARGPRDSAVGGGYNNLGAIEGRRGNLAGAIDYMRRAAEIGRADGHPNPYAEFNVALGELQLGRWNQAIKSFEVALLTAERVSGPSSVRAGEAVAYLGIAMILTGDLQGRAKLLHGIEIMRSVGSPSLASGLAHAARLALHDGDRARAHVLIDESLELTTATDEPLRTLVVAEIKLAEAGCAAARPMLAKVVAGPVFDELEMGMVARVELAECEIAAGETAAAKQRLVAELAQLETNKADEPALAFVRAALAKIKP